MEVRKLLKTCLFQDYYINSYIYISTLISNCTQMKIAHLFTLGPNISWIGEVCHTLNTTSLPSIVGNHWPTAKLRVNFLKAEIGSNTLFLLKWITILPSTPSTGCGTLHLLGRKVFLLIGPETKLHFSRREVSLLIELDNTFTRKGSVLPNRAGHYITLIRKGSVFANRAGHYI